MAQEFRALHATAQSIGFHELRQALEISSLKQDLERVARDTDDLRVHIDEAVELVRSQFAALTTAELADANRMAPILQSAVKALLGIRDAARRIEVTSGPMADADRPDPPPPSSLLHAPAPVSPPPVSDSEAVAEPPRPALRPRAPAQPPSPPPAQPPAPSPTVGSLSWITPVHAPPPRTAGPSQRQPRPAAPVDWLDPPRR